MKKLFIIALLIVATLSSKAQYKFVTHDMSVGVGHPPFPFYWSPYIWWNDSTVTPLQGYRGVKPDTTGTLMMQVNFLLNDDLETHRRLDSLIGEMRRTKQILDNHGW